MGNDVGTRMTKNDKNANNQRCQNVKKCRKVFSLMYSLIYVFIDVFIYMFSYTYLDYRKTTLWVIRALGSEGFEFSRAFSLDARIFTEARFGFPMEFSLKFSLKCSLELPRE